MPFLSEEQLDYIAAEVTARFPNATRSMDQLLPVDNYNPVLAKRYTDILMFGTLFSSGNITRMVPKMTKVTNPHRVSVDESKPFLFFIDPIIFKGDKVVLMQYKQA